MKKLTPEQNKKMRSIGLKFLLKSFWNGLHSAALLIMMNFTLSLVNNFYLGNSHELFFLMSVGCAIFVFKRYLDIHHENNENMKKMAKEALSE